MAAKNRANKELRKELNKTKLQKVDLTTIADSTKQNE